MREKSHGWLVKTTECMRSPYHLIPQVPLGLRPKDAYGPGKRSGDIGVDNYARKERFHSCAIE
jgi:hypothetical protein